MVYEIVNGSDPDHFMINETTGEIVTLGSLDYESLATEYDLIIGATLITPTHELYDETVVRIVVENINDNPPRFTSSLYTVVVEQFTLPNTTIFTVSAIDPDALNDTQFFLVGDNSTYFQIDSSTGELSASSLLDSPGDYIFSIVADDGGTEESTASIFISVTESPLFTAEQFAFIISEDVSPGTYIGSATEGVLTSGEIMFRIIMPNITAVDITVTNTSQALFYIDPTTGNISTQSLLDFDADQRDFAFNIELYNTETGTIYDVALVVVQLEDVNDNPPVFLPSLYTRVINDSQENNSVVAVLTATDRDSGNNSRIKYSFENENMTLGFTLKSTTGEIFVSNSTLVPGDYNITVVAADGGNPALSDYAIFFISIIQIIPEEIEFSEQLYRFQIAEDGLPDTLIGIVQAWDTNSSLTPPSIRYSIPNVTECFSMDMQSGEITLSCSSSLDRESVSDYELEVTAQVGNITTRGVVMIAVLDINDNAPVFSLDTYTKIINATHNATAAILEVIAIDLDQGDNGTVTYHLLSRSDNFVINSTSGEIFLVTDGVEVGDYGLVVEATDMGIPINMSSTASVLVYVTSPHPHSLRFSNLVFNMTENAPPNSTV